MQILTFISMLTISLPLITNVDEQQDEQNAKGIPISLRLILGLIITWLEE